MNGEDRISRKDFLFKTLQLSAWSVLGVSFLAHTACSESLTEDLDVDSDEGSSTGATYSVISSSCDGCGHCLSSCSYNAISISGGIASISSSRCMGCNKCVSACKHDAIIKI